jgi:hypothetical protein
MRGSVTSAKISRLAGAIAALWLLFAAPAWAGGGMDAGALQSTLCQLFAISLNIPCPQYPTYSNTITTAPISPPTPIVVELAASESLSPDKFRMDDSDCALLGTLNGALYCPQLAVNAVNPPAKSPPEDTEDAKSGLKDAEDAKSSAALSHLNPLAFVSATSTTPFTVTQNLDPNATSYVYAVVEGEHGQPDTLDLFFQTGANKKQTKGPVASISFPLAVLSKGAATENSVVATLQIHATCKGAEECFSASVSVDLGMGKTTYNLKDLGLKLEYFSDPSPTWELQIPLLVNPKTDPFYFLTKASLPQCPNGINQASGYCNAFSQTSPPNGFAPKFLKNTFVGMAPSAAPQCPGPQPGTTCPVQTDPTTAPVPPTFGFCASFSKNLAAAFFLAIGPDGTTYISSPVAPSPTMPPAQYPACPS